MPIQSFGPRALRIAHRLAVPDAVVFDLEAFSEAYPRVYERRVAGDLFYGMLVWEHPRAAIARNLGPSIVGQMKTLDDRRIAFALLAQGKLGVQGQTNGAMTTISPQMQRLGWEFSELVTSQVFRSIREVHAFAEFFGRYPSRYETFAVPHDLPNFSYRRAAKGVRAVIWAPEVPAPQTALLAASLEELHGEVYVIHEGGQKPDVRAHYVVASDEGVAELLASASCIVDASLDDPGAALAFAEREMPLVVASTTGADERIAGAVRYDPWDAQSIYRGVLRAACRPTRLRNPNRAALPALRVSEKTWDAQSAKLVSVVITTYLRPDELDGCLTSIERQTYPNVQAVVVNDGGPTLVDVCAKHPAANIKLIELKVNTRGEEATDVAFNAADGAYIFPLADDDRIFPDHVERLMDALAVSGADVAYSDCLMRYRARDSQGTFRDYGYNASTFTGDVDPTEALATPNVHPACVLASREIFQELGLFATDVGGVADNEYLLRMILKYDFVHVDHFTAEVVWRIGGEHAGPREYTGQKGVDNLKALYLRYPSDRPLVKQLREQIIQTVGARRIDAPYIFPPSFVLPTLGR